MWSGLWQAPTLEARTRATRRVIERWIGVPKLIRVERFDHGTTHRDVEFEVWAGVGELGMARSGRRWTAATGLSKLALSNAQKRVLSCGWA